MDEVKSFDSLDSYVRYHLQKWEELNPQPETFGPEVKPPKQPTRRVTVSDNLYGYVMVEPASNQHVRIKIHDIGSDKSVTLIFDPKHLDDFVRRLAELNQEVKEWSSFSSMRIPLELQRWKSKRGEVIGALKREYRALAEEESV